VSGRRPRTLEIERFELECGAVLRNLRQAYFLDGEVAADGSNVVLVFHALTGSADTATWWPGVVGEGRAIDTRRHAVLSVNLLGSCYGTTGPWEPVRRPFPEVTPRDQARFAAHLVDALGVERLRLVVGGSLGGMVAMEWAATFPERTGAAVVIAAPAAHSAAAIAWNHIQRAILDAGGERAVETARMVAMMTFRTPGELEDRFGRNRRGDGLFEVASYLEHHGARLSERFDPHSYRTLLGAMDAHDVGRGRGGVAPALAPVAGRLTGVGIPGDVLYPDTEVRGWVEAAGARYRAVHSPCGHDGFLVETDQVSAILREALGDSPDTSLSALRQTA
jgi:homoserine O-acetyltransferase/O-succinyltransferase